ncbi:aldo/keto reductase [Kosakonia quasisacchari]|uniref:Aldo/keto reductase n=1 Tax=Kosakonia quasisacchari TaxID=2529380 RepID=A0A4R0HDN5_9ENTR|nr:aldo/keto reductase [Kosakonia quasisacchari]TCC09275.1 aldo/keto reductase [Kosakonia quasisacchari]
MDCDNFPLAKDPQYIPLALGTSRLQGKQCIALIDRAINTGYRIIDTARSYKNETDIGLGVLSSGIERNRIFISTKIHLTEMEYQFALGAVGKSLTALHTDYIDLVFIHWPSVNIPLRETISALVELKQQKVIRHIGVSNFPLVYLRYALNNFSDISFIQIEHHPFFKEKQLFDYAVNNGLMIMSYRPTAMGQASLHSDIVNIASKVNATPHQVILKWQMSKLNNIPVCGITNKKHLQANLDAYRLSLSKSDLQVIDNIDNKARTMDRDYAPDWYTQSLPKAWD